MKPDTIHAPRAQVEPEVSEVQGHPWIPGNFKALVSNKENKHIQLHTVVCTYNPAALEAERDAFRCGKPVWATKWVPEQPGYRVRLYLRQASKLTGYFLSPCPWYMCVLILSHLDSRSRHYLKSLLPWIVSSSVGLSEYKWIDVISLVHCISSHPDHKPPVWSTQVPTDWLSHHLLLRCLQLTPSCHRHTSVSGLHIRCKMSLAVLPSWLSIPYPSPALCISYL